MFGRLLPVTGTVLVMAVAFVTPVLATSVPASEAASNPPTTRVLLPSNGATVTGDAWLDARASSPVGIASVNYELSGGSFSSPHVISGSTPTLYGYIGAWNSTTVPNGTYTIRSVATDVDGVRTTSAPITINVSNGPTSTSVIIPSTGATQSGTAALLDATSTADVTSVSYKLSGGTLSNKVIATGTASLYGWLATWDTTSVPDGSYTLQSVGSVAGGATVTSAQITIDVSNPLPLSDLNSTSIIGTVGLLGMSCPAPYTAFSAQLWSGSYSSTTLGTVTFSMADCTANIPTGPSTELTDVTVNLSANAGTFSGVTASPVTTVLGNPYELAIAGTGTGAFAGETGTFSLSLTAPGGGFTGTISQSS
jgi:hypothetical protein